MIPCCGKGTRADVARHARALIAIGDVVCWQPSDVDQRYTWQEQLLQMHMLPTAGNCEGTTRGMRKPQTQGAAYGTG